jgi:two-component system phosphoglycerate transport system sensor histidine kinase PgtB
MDAGHKLDKPHQDVDLRAFVSGLTHEIANPLNAIAMNCDLLRLVVDRGDLARVREIAERLQASSTRGASLVRGLQSFGSALRRNPAESVAAGLIFENAIRAATNGRAESPPQFHVDGASVLLDVDRTALEHALAGLLCNSIEAKCQRVDIGVRANGDHVIIDIRDDGCGFSAHDIKRAEKPFFSNHRFPNNAGLGLTLAREVMRAASGSLRVRSVEGGAHVEIELPAAASNASSSNAARADSKVGP